MGFLGTNSETFTTFLTIVLIYCTYLLEYTVKQQYFSEAFSVALSFKIGYKCGLWLYVGAGQTQVMFGVSNLEQ